MLLKLLQARVQLESIVAGGESSDEDVRAFVVGLILFEVGVDDLDRVIVSDPDLTYVLFLLVLPDVPFFVLRCDGVSGVSGGLLLESSVYVFGVDHVDRVIVSDRT